MSVLAWIQEPYNIVGSAILAVSTLILVWSLLQL